MSKPDGLIALLVSMLVLALFRAVPAPQPPTLSVGAAHESASPPVHSPVTTAPAPVTDAVSRRQLIQRAVRATRRPFPNRAETLHAAYASCMETASQLAASGITLDEGLENAFVDRLQKLKKAHFLHRTRDALEEFVRDYEVPGPQEKETIARDLDRLRMIQSEVDWVQERYGTRLSRSHRDYLNQVIEILTTHSRL